jgi:two-component system, OmpR family, sensor histidine kinase KdpD
MRWPNRLRPLTSRRRVALFTGFAWLLVVVIVPRFTLASGTINVLAFLVAVVAGSLAGHAAYRIRRAARATAMTGSARPAGEADRMRAALLAAVSHDLRSPLAAATAAVSGLRTPDLQLTAADQDELLATARESLDLLSHLAASLLDVTRLQVGARSVFPRPADLEEIIASSLAGLGCRARAVRVDLPPGLPEVMADPPVAERVIANLTANAIRYSPAGSPPLLTARARGGRVELRVTDHGPGVPQADQDKMFEPFQRLGDTDLTTGVGLGLAASRGLTEAMHGTLEPEQTPGGGLTMTVSLPAAPSQASAQRARPGWRERETEPVGRCAEPGHHDPGAWHGAVTLSQSPASSPAGAGV